MTEGMVFCYNCKELLEESAEEKGFYECPYCEVKYDRRQYKFESPHREVTVSPTPFLINLLLYLSGSIKIMENIFPSNNTNLEGADSPLCLDCRKLGYCRQLKSEEVVTKYSLKDYISLVPLQVSNSRLGNYSRHHVQHAHDAFHRRIMKLLY